MADVLAPTRAETVKLGLETAAAPVAKKSPEFTRHVVEGVRKHLEEGRVRDALTDLAEPGRKVTKDSAKKSMDAIPQGDVMEVGTDGKPVKNPDGTVKFKISSESSTRVGEASKVVADFADIAQNGFDKATPAAQKRAVDSLTAFFQDQDTIVAALGMDPADPSARALVAPQARKMAEAMLKNPQYAHMLKNGIADFVGDQPVDYGELQAAQIAQNAAEAEVKRIGDRLTELGDASKPDSVEALKQKLDSFSETTSIDRSGKVVIKRGAFAEARANLESQLKALALDVTTADNQIGLLQQYSISRGIKYPVPYMNGQLDSAAAVANEIVKLTTEKAAIQTSMSDVDTKVKAINAEKVKVEADHKKAVDEKAQLENDKKGADAVKESADRKVVVASKDVADAETSLKAAAEAVLTDTAVMTWKEAITEVEAKYEEQMPQDEAEIVKAMKGVLTERYYHKVSTKKGRMVGEWDSAAIGRDASYILSHGTETYAKTELTALHMSLKASKVPEQQRQAAMIEQILNNPDKLGEMGAELAQEVFAFAAVKSPKTIEGLWTTDEKQYRMMTGDILPSIIDRALNNNHLKDMLTTEIADSSVTGEKGGSTRRAKLAEAFGKMDKKRLRKLLTMLGGAAVILGGLVLKGGIKG
jgi:hypothetical protein